MERLIFQFHGRLRLIVQSEDEHALRFFDAEYGLHRGEGRTDLPTVELCFGCLPRVSNVRRGFSAHSHKVLAHWKYRIHFASRTVQIEATGNRFSIPMIHHMLVHPGLRYLAAQEGLLLLHSGAVARSGRSILFSGYGGAGKTTTTSLLLAYGQPTWQVHADDYAFLVGGATSLGYWTRAHLYRDLLGWVPEIAQRLTGAERLRLEILGRIRRWSGERIKWPVRLSLPRLWPDNGLAAEAQPAALVLLRRAAVEEPHLLPCEDSLAVVEELLEMNFYEARHFLALVRKNEALDEDALAMWRRRERSLIEQTVAQIEARILQMPQKRLSAPLLAEGLARALDEVGA